MAIISRIASQGVFVRLRKVFIFVGYGSGGTDNDVDNGSGQQKGDGGAEGNSLAEQSPDHRHYGTLADRKQESHAAGHEHGEDPVRTKDPFDPGDGNEDLDQAAGQGADQHKGKGLDYDRQKIDRDIIQQVTPGRSQPLKKQEEDAGEKDIFQTEGHYLGRSRWRRLGCVQGEFHGWLLKEHRWQGVPSVRLSPSGIVVRMKRQLNRGEKSPGGEAEQGADQQTSC